jgi:hypothetical protein
MVVYCCAWRFVGEVPVRWKRVQQKIIFFNRSANIQAISRREGDREMSVPTNTDQSLLIVVNRDQTNQSSEEQIDGAFRRMERLHFRNYMDEFRQNAHGILERFWFDNHVMMMEKKWRLCNDIKGIYQK